MPMKLLPKVVTPIETWISIEALLQSHSLNEVFLHQPQWLSIIHYHHSQLIDQQSGCLKHSPPTCLHLRCSSSCTIESYGNCYWFGHDRCVQLLYTLSTSTSLSKMPHCSPQTSSHKMCNRGCQTNQAPQDLWMCWIPVAVSAILNILQWLLARLILTWKPTHWNPTLQWMQMLRLINYSLVMQSFQKKHHLNLNNGCLNCNRKLMKQSALTSLMLTSSSPSLG